MNEELFLHLAEIAGVFVGFGALITLRNSAESRDPHSRGYLRGIVWTGAVTIVLALLPLLLAEYGLSGHALWLTCAVIAPALWLTFVIIFNRAPEMSGDYERAHRAYGIAFVSIGMPLHLTILGGSLLIILGILPAAEPALYATVVAATLVFAAWTLVMLTWDPLAKKRHARHAESTSPADSVDAAASERRPLARG